MKRFALLVAIGATLAVLSGCNDNSEPEEVIPENITLTVSAMTVDIAPEGGSVDVVVASNYKWELVGESDWCTPSVTSGEANEQGQVISFSATKTLEKREASFMVTCADQRKYVDVRQDMVRIIDFGESATRTVSGMEGELTVEYTSNVLCEIDIPQEAREWLYVAPAAESTRGSMIAYEIKFNVMANNTGEARSTKVKFYDYEHEAYYSELEIVQNPRYRLEYTTTDGKRLVSFDGAAFGATMLSYYYEEDRGYIEFDAPVTEIMGYAFMNCTNLATITIPNTVVKVHDFAFASCPGLYEFKGNFASADGRYLAEDTKMIAFAPSGLRDYSIPNGITKLSHSLFFQCDELVNITIPESVNYIGYFAFDSCSKLERVYCRPTTPPTGGNDMFYGNASSRRIYVPTASVDAYKSADIWSDYADSIFGYDY